MNENNKNLSHIMYENEMQNAADFSRVHNQTNNKANIQSERSKIENEKRKLEKIIQKKIEKTDKVIEKKNNNVSLFSKLVGLFKKKQKNISIADVNKRDNSKINNDKTEEKKKLKELELQKKKEINDKKKQEKAEKLKVKKELLEQQEQEKQRIREEKNRKKEEKKLLDLENRSKEKEKKEKAKIETPEEIAKKEAKRLLKEKKEAEKLKKEEEKKEKLKKKYEEKARRKHEKEEKEIELIRKKREQEKKNKKEKEEAKKQKKERDILIKKAQEESKLKAKQERKSFKEKISNWYNNLSFVKDVRNRRELQRQTLLIDFEGADAVRSEEKIVYKYVAKNKDTGKIETGMFAAFSKLDVHSFLLAEGYEVYEISPQKSISKGFTLTSPKFNASELDFFLTQLSTFLKSGITLIDSVKILSKQSKKSAQKNVYKSVIYELSMGENFSEALSKQGNVFPRLLINMIKTSELTGDLPETLDDMADYYRETEKTRKQMISALTYPAVVLSFAVVILIFIMVSVIPQFVSIYDNMDTGLPAITVIVIKLSDFLKLYWIYVVAGIVMFIVLFIILFKSIKVFRTMIQSITMNLPVFGKIIIYNEVTMFTKTFASLLNHNVYITDCMEVLSKITGNEIYKMLIFDTITNLAKGEAISNSFRNHWAFPNIAYEMILTGEKTGKLGEMMDKVAKYYQEQHKNAVNQIKAFIEPVMIIALAAIVGVVLLSVILPMFDMYQNIGM